MTSPQPTVLIVDDDSSVCRSLSRLPRQEGMSTRSFASAEEFLFAPAETWKHPACMVLDLQMPGLNGLELQQRLARHPATARSSLSAAMTPSPPPSKPCSREP